MASGDPVVEVVSILPPETLFGRPDRRLGGSTPKENVRLYDFDPTTIWYLDFICRLHGYGGGGLTFNLDWSASTATTGETRWGIGIRRFQVDAEDLDAAHTYDYNDVDDTAPSLAGEVVTAVITFTNGADMDSWADGELGIVRVRRNASHANDDMAGDAELWNLFGKET